MSNSKRSRTSPPHRADLEQEVVAAMLVHDQAVPWAASLLQPADFYLARYRVVFEALVSVHGIHGLADVVLLKEHLEAAGHWATMGGHNGLSEILNRHGYTDHLESYAATLKGYALQRRIQQAGQDIEALGASDDDMGQEDRLQHMDQLVRTVYEQAGVSQLTDATACVREHMATVDEAESRDGMVGVSTGLRRMDAEVGGLRPGWQVLILAASGVGKSALAINNLALGTAKQGHPVAIFSLEMTRQEVVGRMIAAVSSVPYHIQVRGKMDPHDRVRYEEGLRIVEQLPVYVDEGDLLTIEQLGIRARALQHQLGRPLGMIVVDYLQLMESKARHGNRTEELSMMTRSLKRLAKQLSTVVVTLSQPTAEGARSSRGGDRDLTLADAKGSQSIGADVDLAILINRHEASGRLSLAAGKFRHGPTWRLTEDDVRWHGGRMAFEDLG